MLISLKIIWFVFKSNEHSEDFYIGLTDFFLLFSQEKVIKY